MISRLVGGDALARVYPPALAAARRAGADPVLALWGDRLS